MQILIAGVGYHNLRDMSAGPALVHRLCQLDWPPEIEIDDLSFGPIAVVQRFQDQPDRYERIIFVAAVERGRQPGQVVCYRWDGAVPADDDVQERVNEAVTGVISLDNLLIITQHFGVLPNEVIVVEVEPEDTGWGLGFTPTIEAALDEVIATVRKIAMDGYYG